MILKIIDEIYMMMSSFSFKYR